MVTRRDRRGWTVVLAGFAILCVVAAAYGWIGRHVLRSLIDDRRDAKVLAVGLVLVPAALLGLAAYLGSRTDPRYSRRTTASLAIVAVSILLVGLLGGTAGSAQTRSRGDALARELHGFPN